MPWKEEKRNTGSSRKEILEAREKKPWKEEKRNTGSRRRETLEAGEEKSSKSRRIESLEGGEEKPWKQEKRNPGVWSPSLQGAYHVIESYLTGYKYLPPL
jgi:hypothetical protein